MSQDISGKPASAPGNDNPVQTPGLQAKARARAMLVSLLTEYDERLASREHARRQVPNVYRLGHYMRAAEGAFERVCRGMTWGEALADCFTYRQEPSGAYVFDLPPVRNFLRWLLAHDGGAK